MSMVSCITFQLYVCFFFFQAEDGIRDLVRSRGLGDVYKRQGVLSSADDIQALQTNDSSRDNSHSVDCKTDSSLRCLLYTSDAADERSSVDLGGRRIIKKKKEHRYRREK